MTNRKETLLPRQLRCSGCGTPFTCSLSGECWCAEEQVRLPMPTEGADCLCRDCLRKLGAAQAAASSDPAHLD